MTREEEFKNINEKLRNKKIGDLKHITLMLKRTYNSIEEAEEDVNTLAGMVIHYMALSKQELTEGGVSETLSEISRLGNIAIDFTPEEK